jgi:hypothetical protein
MLPYEVLRDIFHRATFIRHERDLNAASGFSCESDRAYQLRAWEESLPLRITIARVSRRWRAVALEFLYASFHETEEGSKLAPFASMLSAYPHYGTLVKRLMIRHPFEQQALVSGILQRCPNLLVFSFIDIKFRYEPSLFSFLSSGLSILPMNLKQLDALNLSGGLILTLLPCLPQLEILILGAITDGIVSFDHPKIVLPRLRILQLTFNMIEGRPIPQFIRNFELPSLSAMCIGLRFVYPFPALPKDLSKRLEYLDLFSQFPDISAWEAEDFRKLRVLRLDWKSLHSSSLVCPHLPMNQIVELICTFPDLEFKTPFTPGEEVEQIINFLLDPTVMPNLRSLTFEDGPINWDQGEEKPKLRDEWIAAYIEDLATSFDQRGVDLWFNRPETPWKEGVLVRDILCMHKRSE